MCNISKQDFEKGVFMEKNERRKGVRNAGEFAFRFKKIGEKGRKGPVTDGTLIDYSIAGIRFVTGERLEKNTALEIELDFEKFGYETKNWRSLWDEYEATSLQVIGSVMWCQQNKQIPGEFEVGTRFVEKA
jgi:hypothetical protein